MTQHAFDNAATTYDADFTCTRLGRWLRELVWEQLAGLFAEGDRVLELGCGTGEDAVWLAQRGIAVTATDASPGMLEVAQAKAEVAGVSARVAFAELDLGQNCGTAELRNQEPTTQNPEPSVNDQQRTPAAQTTDYGLRNTNNQSPILFDGALSNFGALNCVPDRQPVAELLGRLVRPGGRLALVVMSPLCPWEIGWHLLRGRPGAALRRFRGGVAAHVGGGRSIEVWYPSPARLRSEFAAQFRHVGTRGVGALLPPSYLSPVVDRWPALFGTLGLVERRVASRLPWTWLNDHYLMVFERR
jgi:SAM-dependent methyltransferase